MKIKREYIYGGVAIIIIIFAVFYVKYSLIKPKKDETKEDKISWYVDKDGYLVYPLNRGDILFNRQTYDETKNLTISKVIFQSTKGNIYGLLVLPKSASELLPGIVLLPGAGVSKESKLELAKKIAELDAAVLVIDQRGIGETDGILPTLDEDYQSFASGKEPMQHIMIYDALRAYDLLYSAPFVDPDRIMIAGESFGGRIAVIAAAIDRNIKGVLVISSAGFDFEGGPDANKNAFLKSIDADHYISLISPRKLVMMHNKNENIIPLDSAVNTYLKAQEPKEFVLVNDSTCNHGYCDSMYNGLVESLDYLVGIKSRTLFSVPVK